MKSEENKSRSNSQFSLTNPNYVNTNSNFDADHVLDDNNTNNREIDDESFYDFPETNNVRPEHYYENNLHLKKMETLDEIHRQPKEIFKLTL